MVCGLVIFQYTNYCLYTPLYMYTGEYSCILSISYWLLHINIKSKTPTRWQEVKNKQMEKGPIWIKSISTVFPSDELQSNPHIIMQGMT